MSVNYAESDVHAGARAWTGYNYERATRAYIFRPTKQDTGLKTFFGQNANWDGPGTITEMLQTSVAKRLIAARFITRKLWEFLAYARPAANIVNELADVFIAAAIELRPLLTALLNRAEFYGPSQAGSRAHADGVVRGAAVHHGSYRQ